MRFKILTLLALTLGAVSAQAQTWTNRTLTNQTGTFVAVFDAVPSQSGSAEDVAIGLANGPASQYANLAAIVRFNPLGRIDARNGSSYTSLASVPYSAGTNYHFRMEVNIAARTYTVYVNGPSGSKILLAQNYAFRSDFTGGSQLNNLASGVLAGGVTISQVALIPTTPVLTGNVVSTSQINLSWTAARPPAGYSIQSYSIIRNGSSVATVPGTQTSLNNTGLAASTTYTYQVRAIQSNGAVSDLSNLVSLTTQGVSPEPTNVPVPLITNFSGVTASTIYIAGRPYYVGNPNKPYSLTNPDTQTLRFELRSGERQCDRNWCDSSAERTEIAESYSYLHKVGSTINISYDFMMESGQISTANWLVIGQLHDYNVSTSPPFDISLEKGDRMGITVGWLKSKVSSLSSFYSTSVNGQAISYGYAYLDPNPIQRGRYYRIQVTIKFDTNSGYLKVVRDGVTIVNYTGPLGYGFDTYWKMGIYRAPTSNDIQAARYRNFIIN